MILEAANKYYTKLHRDLQAIKDYIKYNPGLFLTVLYLLGSFSGVVYLATLLNSFSVDVFQHIELTDFLLALVSHPGLVLTYTVLTLGIAYAIHLELKRIRSPKKLTLWQKFYHGISFPTYLLNPTYSLLVLFFLFLCGYSYVFANAQSERVHEKKTQSYSISLNDPIQQDKKTFLANVQIVASTARNLFIYDNKQEKLLIIPQNNIAAVVPIIKDKSPVKAKAASKKTIKETKQS